MLRDFDAELRGEGYRILESDAFVRSPVQSRLLRYLLERTLSARKDPITQFDIATEGLGKGNDYDESAESYVRVHISRLRKSLAAYYAVSQPSNGCAVYIRPGRYELSLGSIDVAYPSLLPTGAESAVSALPDTSEAIEKVELQEPRDSPIPEKPVQSIDRLNPNWLDRVRTKRAAFALGMCAVIFVGLIGAPRPFNSIGGGEGGEKSHIGLSKPTVAVNVVGAGYFAQAEAGQIALRAARLEVMERLERSIVSEPALEGEEADFTIEILLLGQPSQTKMLQLDVRSRSGEIIHQHESSITTDLQALKSAIGWDLAYVVSPPGFLSRHLADQIPSQPRNDFECFVFVEVGRSIGGENRQLLDGCSGGYSESEFYPYLAARNLFQRFQKEMMAEGEISPRSDVWRDLGAAIREHKDNSYLHTVAAKVLYSSDQCEEAAFHEEKALFRGRDYPALHLAIMVEKAPCLKDDAELAELKTSIIDVTAVQAEPHALLQAFSLSALMVVGETEAALELPRRPFAFERDQPLVEFSSQLRGYAAGLTDEQPDAMRALVWNPESRTRILAARR